MLITKVFADIAEEEVAITSKSSKVANSSSNLGYYVAHHPLSPP